MIIRELLYVVVVPFVVAACAAFVNRRWGNPPQIVWAAGVGIGYLAGQLGLAGRARPTRAFWSFARPHEAVDWLPHAVLLALGVTIFAIYAPRKWRRLAIALAVLLSIGLPLRLLAGSDYVTHQWSMLEKLSHLALLAATLRAHVACAFLSTRSRPAAASARAVDCRRDWLGDRDGTVWRAGLRRAVRRGCRSRKRLPGSRRMHEDSPAHRVSSPVRLAVSSSSVTSTPN